MDCHRCQENLEDYLRKVLGKSERDEVDAHIQDCSECSRELETLEKYFATLKVLEPVDPPPDFLRSIHQRLEKPAFQKRVTLWIAALFPRPMPVRLAGVTLSLILVTVVYIAVFKPIDLASIQQEKSLKSHKAPAPAAAEQIEQQPKTLEHKSEEVPVPRYQAEKQVLFKSKPAKFEKSAIRPKENFKQQKKDNVSRLPAKVPVSSNQPTRGIPESAIARSGGNQTYSDQQFNNLQGQGIEASDEVVEKNAPVPKKVGRQSLKKRTRQSAKSATTPISPPIPVTPKTRRKMAAAENSSSPSPEKLELTLTLRNSVKSKSDDLKKEGQSQKAAITKIKALTAKYSGKIKFQMKVNSEIHFSLSFPGQKIESLLEDLENMGTLSGPRQWNRKLKLVIIKLKIL